MDAAETSLRPGIAHLLLPLPALLAAAASAMLILGGRPEAGGVAVAAAAVAVVGVEPAAERSGWPRIRLVSSITTRLVDGAILGVLVWVLLPGEPTAALGATVALSSGFVAAYLRVKGAGLGLRAPAWPGLQPLRLAALAVALLTPGGEAAVWVAAALGVGEVTARAALLAWSEGPA